MYAARAHVHTLILFSLVHTAQTYFRHLLFKTAASIQMSSNADSTPKLSPHLSENRQRTVLARIHPQLLFIPSYEKHVFSSSNFVSLLSGVCGMPLIRALHLDAPCRRRPTRALLRPAWAAFSSTTFSSTLHFQALHSSVPTS